MGIGALVMGGLFVLCLIGDEYFLRKAQEPDGDTS